MSLKKCRYLILLLARELNKIGYWHWCKPRMFKDSSGSFWITATLGKWNHYKGKDKLAQMVLIPDRYWDQRSRSLALKCVFVFCSPPESCVRHGVLLGDGVGGEHRPRQERELDVHPEWEHAGEALLQCLGLLSAVSFTHSVCVTYWNTN